MKSEDWLPIEDIPDELKNGRKVLGWRKDIGAFMMRYEMVDSKSGGFAWCAAGFSRGYTASGINQPTRYQEIVEPDRADIMGIDDIESYINQGQLTPDQFTLIPMTPQALIAMQKYPILFLGQSKGIDKDD